MNAFALILAAHIVCGTLALASLAVPFLSRYGGKVHKRAGWLFTVSMAGVSLSSWVMSALRLLDEDLSNNDTAIFLAHIGLLSGTSVYLGVRAARLKRNVGARLRGDVAIPVLLLFSSVAMLIAGILKGDVLWIVFSVIGFLGGAAPFPWLLGYAKSRHEWIAQHLSSMGTGAISAITAFFVVNVESLGLQQYALAFWIAPGAIGGVVLSLLSRRVRDHGLAGVQRTSKRNGGPSSLETVANPPPV